METVSDSMSLFMGSKPFTGREKNWCPLSAGQPQGHSSALRSVEKLQQMWAIVRFLRM